MPRCTWEQVRDPDDVDESERPEIPAISDLPRLQTTAREGGDAGVDAYIGLMKACWGMDVGRRPPFENVRAKLDVILRNQPPPPGMQPPRRSWLRTDPALPHHIPNPFACRQAPACVPPV